VECKLAEPGTPAKARLDRSAVHVTVAVTCPPGRNTDVSTETVIWAQASPAPDSVAAAAPCAARCAWPGLEVNDAARAAAADACSTRILFWLYRPNATIVNSNTITTGVTITNSMIEEPRSPTGRRVVKNRRIRPGRRCPVGAASIPRWQAAARCSAKITLTSPD